VGYELKYGFRHPGKQKDWVGPEPEHISDIHPVSISFDYLGYVPHRTSEDLCECQLSCHPVNVPELVVIS